MNINPFCACGSKGSDYIYSNDPEAIDLTSHCRGMQLIMIDFL
jgi:hypothetical protein